MKNTFLVLTISLFLIGCSSVEKSLPAGDFRPIPGHVGYFEGTVYISGYAELKEIVEPFCDYDCDTFTYVDFVVEDYGETPGLEDFLYGDRGNAFIDSTNASIGLGCLLGENIVYSNSTEQYEISNANLGSILTDKILKSSSQNPLQLKLTKKYFISGGGAPTCYSHFSVIEEFKE